MPPRKFFRICIPEIESGTSFDGNYKAMKLMVGGQPPPSTSLDQSLMTQLVTLNPYTLNSAATYHNVYDKGTKDPTET